MNFADSYVRSKWQRHRRKWTGCQACPLHVSVTEYVFARGDLPADILFIGEAPGETEDILGQPFVGRAGKLLDQFIRDVQVKLKRGFSYAITNILMCRPTPVDGLNRPPTPDEALACSPRLADFLKICEPVAIVTLGKVAAKFSPEKSLPHLEISHPSYWLRTGHAHGLAYKQSKVYLTKFLREHV